MDHEAAEELLVAIEATGDDRGALSIAELLARRDRINARLIEVDGTIVKAVADEARKGNTRLVLLPLPAPGQKRPQGAETVIAIANATGVPVLGVPRHQELLPTRALVATDFSSASTRAARTALSLLGPEGHLSLVHVETESDYAAVGRSRVASAERIARLLEQLRHELDEETLHSAVLGRRRTSIVKETVVLQGSVAPAILAYAGRHRNDLIVVGTRRVRASYTMPLGSVALAVLREARSAVLVTLRRVGGPTDTFFKAHDTAT